MKSNILDKLAEAIYTHNPYPAHEEYDRVAQAIISKYPWGNLDLSMHGTIGSLKFKMGNIRQKMRVAEFSG